jgi:hypothetical protein
MRVRTSWNQKEIAARQASTVIASDDPADLASMNAPEHAKAQPSAEEYMNGDPSSWAEDVHPPDWKDEYSDGQTDRNEIGMPEMKTAMTMEQAVKKAKLAYSLAKRTLGRRVASAVLEDQAYSFMHLPTEHLVEAYNRTAEFGEPMAEEDAAQEQMEQLQVQAEQLLSAGKWAEAQQCLAQIMEMQAQQQQAPAAQQQVTQAQQQQAPAAPQQVTQAQQQQAPVQQQVTQAQQQQAPAQAQQQHTASITMTQAQLNAYVAKQVKKAQQQVQQQQVQQQQVEETQQVQASDDLLLDSLLDPVEEMPVDLLPEESPVDPMESEIFFDDVEMDSPMMDDAVGDSDLESLFMGGDEAQAALAQQQAPVQQVTQAQQQQVPAAQQQQTHTARVASRMGTRPPGVSRINGGPSPRNNKGSAASVADLSKLWNAPPDVSGAFRLPTAYDIASSDAISGSPQMR